MLVGIRIDVHCQAKLHFWRTSTTALPVPSGTARATRTRGYAGRCPACIPAPDGRSGGRAFLRGAFRFGRRRPAASGRGALETPRPCSSASHVSTVCSNPPTRASRRFLGVDRGLRGHHFSRRRAPPEVHQPARGERARGLEHHIRDHGRAPRGHHPDPAPGPRSVERRQAIGAGDKAASGRPSCSQWAEALPVLTTLVVLQS
jgi:hypothetical protein